MPTFTDAAKAKILETISSNNLEAIKFGARGGGCAGFVYFLEPCNLSSLERDDMIDDTNGFHLIIDGASAPIVQYVTIGLHESLMESHFTFDNPLSHSGCGCGTSFSVDYDDFDMID